jgi:putative DNA primase/helicase
MTAPSDLSARRLRKLADADPGSRKKGGAGKTDGTAAPPPPEGAIAIKGGSLSHNADSATDALLSADAGIYQHGPRLVRIGRADATDRPGKRTRAPGSPVLFELSAPWLVDELTRRVKWVKFDRRASDWVPTNAPRQVAETILARAGSWPFRRLSGFIEAPALLPDGSVIRAPGYHAETALILLESDPDA